MRQGPQEKGDNALGSPFSWNPFWMSHPVWEESLWCDDELFVFFAMIVMFVLQLRQRFSQLISPKGTYQ